MSWANVLKKNINKKVDKKIEKVEKEVELNEELYNEDEEYDIKYGDNLYNIERIFKNIIKNEGLPFLNKFNFTYSFYDFIKFNSVEYGKTIDEVEKLNKDVDINDSNDEYSDDEY